MFENQLEQLLRTIDDAHSAFYASGVFRGPSLFFHLRSLEGGRSGEVELFAESVYALLAAWGMHRMGKGGSKMRDFKEFSDSLRAIWPRVLSLQQAAPGDLDESGWSDFRDVFMGIRCMASATSLVGNSKVMAHALPNLIPPVDREYTLRLLFGKGNIVNDINREWTTLRNILVHFFYPVVRAKSFLA